MACSGLILERERHAMRQRPMPRTSYRQAMLDLEQLFAAVERPQSEEAERLRMQLELNLIEYKALRELRRTLEEARQEMTIRLHDKLRRLRRSGRRLRSVLQEEHKERNPELILYEGAPLAARKTARKPAWKPRQRPAKSGERCRRCQSGK